MTLSPPRIGPPSDLTPAVGTKMTSDPDSLQRLLEAFYYLQSQNSRMSLTLAAEFGVSAHDLRVILFLDQPQLITPKDVAAKLAQNSGTITALIDRLESSGHIIRTPHPTDRRALVLQLTETGRDVATRTITAYRDVFASAFTAEDIPAATRIVSHLGSALDTGANAGEQRN